VHVFCHASSVHDVLGGVDALGGFSYNTDKLLTAAGHSSVSAAATD
jgi:hypothetical protein